MTGTKIRINDSAKQFNCHWYCNKVGNTYTAKKFNDKLRCYVVMIERKEHLVYEKHADVCYD